MYLRESFATKKRYFIPDPGDHALVNKLDTNILFKTLFFHLFNSFIDEIIPKK